MDIVLNNYIEKIDLEDRSIETVISKINLLLQLESKNAYLSHLVIDGIEVYEGFESFINSNLKNIYKIELIVQSPRTMYNEALLSTINYLERSIPSIEDLSEEFFKSPNEGAWEGLIKLTEGIEWITRSINALKAVDESIGKNDWLNINHGVTQLNDEVSNINEALMEKDYTLVSDLLKYEIIPIFNHILKGLHNRRM